VVTHEEPQPNYGRRTEAMQRLSPQQDDSSPSHHTEWGELADLVRPAVYGDSWRPAVRIAMILAVLAVVVVAALALALILRA
jgi:hypothetical protein